MNNLEQNVQKIIRPSSSEQKIREQLLHLYENTPIPREQIIENLELYMRPQRISEILSLEKIYEKILNTHGVIMEFGVRWGRHLSTFSAFRSVFEPYNFYRKIIGFDTFAGFLELSQEDGKSDKVYVGSMSVSKGYMEHLQKILTLHEAEAPLSHISRTELRQGDAPVELKKYLEEHPETIIALAYFDMDVYKPTKECLELIKPFLIKGSILAFDELMHQEFPGETIALKNVMDITTHRIERFSTAPYPCYVVM